jgi:hypothetical protein
MKKWIFSALAYLVIVIAGYSLYTNFVAADEEKLPKSEHAEENSHGSEHAAKDMENHGDDHGPTESDVAVDLKYKDGNILISLQDKEGTPIKDLEVNHEKLIHLILVDEHLDQYFHLHPDQLGDGEFEVAKNLEEGNYKAFVDIKPNGLDYVVQPIAFSVGNSDSEHTHGDALKPDSELKQTIDNKTTVLNMSSQEAGKTVTLSFDLDETDLEPYLGAMGHVVILDEAAGEYLHVHPVDHENPIFETQFEEPGVYKIWAEFKQGGNVRAFPFVVEIK